MDEHTHMHINSHTPTLLWTDEITIKHTHTHTTVDNVHESVILTYMGAVPDKEQFVWNICSCTSQTPAEVWEIYAHTSLCGSQLFCQYPSSFQKTNRQTDRERDRDTHTHAQRERERERKREREREMIFNARHVLGLTSEKTPVSSSFSSALPGEKNQTDVGGEDEINCCSKLFREHCNSSCIVAPWGHNRVWLPCAGGTTAGCVLGSVGLFWKAVWCVQPQMAVSSAWAEDSGLSVGWYVMHLVIRWQTVSLYPLLTKVLLDQSFGLFIRDFKVGLLLLVVILG